jgi:hypothetical protein
LNAILHFSIQPFFSLIIPYISSFARKKISRKNFAILADDFFGDLAQDLLACHFGSFRAKSAILAVALSAIVAVAKQPGLGGTTHPLWGIGLLPPIEGG